jgi:hypothetical protein
MRRIALREYGEGEHVVAYRDRLYRFTDANDEDDQALAADAAEFLGVDLPGRRDEAGVWELIDVVREQKQEALVGRVDDGDLLVEADDYRHGRGSRLLRGVLRHLGLSGVRVQYEGDVVEDIPAGDVTGRLPDALLHGTSSANMGGILRRGLAADETRSNYELHDIRHADTVFLTDNPFKAAHHAENACQPMGRGSWTNRRVAPSSTFPVIVEFAIPDKSKLVPDWDIDVWSEKGEAYEGSREMRQRQRDSWGRPTTQEDPFKLSRKFGVFGYRGRIPPAFIRSIQILTGDREESFSSENWTEVTREQLERAIDAGEPGAWEWEDTCPECGADEDDCECEKCEECGEAGGDCTCGMVQRCPSCGYADDQKPEWCHRCGKPWAQGVVASAFWRAHRVVASAAGGFDLEYYMSEACAYFALALHELYGYRIRMLVDEVGFGVGESGMPVVAHVYAVDPEGNAVDARGRRSEAEVRAEFYDLVEPRTYDVTPSELETDWMGDDKPLYGPSPAEVEEARRLILHLESVNP